MRTSSERQIPVGTASAVVAPLNCRRVRILFCGDGVNTFTLSTNGPVVANAGLVIATALTAIEIDRDDVGDAITKEWYCICSAATGVLTVHDTID